MSTSPENPAQQPESAPLAAAAVAPAAAAPIAAPGAAPHGVWARLREHKVMQWTLAYAAAAYTLLHVVEMLSEAQDWPHAIVRVISLLLIVGVPVVMTLAWYHGARAQRHVSGSELTIITLLLFIGGTALWALSRSHGESAHGTAAAAHPATEPPSAAVPGGTALPAMNDKSIAVLPFADMSEAKDQEYFADGMAEEILDLLSRIPALKVIARTSSFQFKGKATDVRSVARQLGVATVLEGSVRKAGKRLRITTQLIRAADGSHLWSETYDRQVDDVFRIQDDIAGAIVKRLQLSLFDNGRNNPAPTTSADAHALYLQASFSAAQDTIEALGNAVKLLQRAIAVDPNYAYAYARLSICYSRLVSAGVGTDGSGYANARSAAEHAIALDPTLADGYAALGTARMQYELNWRAAAEMAAKARALDPNNPQLALFEGHLVQAVGSMSEAVAIFRRAVDRDPLNLLMRRYYGRMLYHNGQVQEAATQLRRAIELNPKFPAVHYELGRVLLTMGDRRGALAAFETEPSATWRQLGMPLGLHAVGQAEAAHKALTELLANSSGSEYQVAEVFAYLADASSCFKWLERARELHDPGVMLVRTDPSFKPLARDPRYLAFLSSVGLKPL